jgi:hypothetical protein
MLREQQRWAQCRQQDPGAERDPLGARSQRGEHRERVVACTREWTIADPDRVEAKRLGTLAEREQRRGGRVSKGNGVAGRQ